jgi:LmbE family N-acetylglucosaminyl deacetylase
MKNQTKKFSGITSPFKRLALIGTLVIVLSFGSPFSGTAVALPLATAEKPARPMMTSLQSVQRVLVIAPHPDDETLAAGGLIQAALANGAQVKVVLVTNGDGQFFGPMLVDKKIIPSAADYIDLAVRRQAESLAALMDLGLSPADVIFLGYPDRGIEPMWQANWDQNHPYKAPFTRVLNSPYHQNFRPAALYCGQNLLSDMETIMQDYRPDLIVFSNPADQHADHRAVGYFTLLSINTLQTIDPNYQPSLWAYLVHYGNYPESVDGNQSVFTPPTDLTSKDWISLELTSAQEQNKSRAIQDYSTQNLLLGNFLPAFARSNEIFQAVTVGSSPADPVRFPAITLGNKVEAGLAY